MASLKPDDQYLEGANAIPRLVNFHVIPKPLAANHYSYSKELIRLWTGYPSLLL